jgi:isochorismate hydrolase
MMDFKIESLKIKEDYFTEKTIEELSETILTQVSCFQNRHEHINFHIKKSVLFVLDMQKYFLSEGSHAFIPSSKAIVPGINHLIKYFETNGRPVILSRHIDSENNTTMKKWWHGSINKTDHFSEISDKIKYRNALIFEKSYYDFFKETDLYEYLKEKAVESVVITGVMTHLCCETTARSAFMNDFEVFFPVDATATYNSLFHMSTFINLSHGFVIPTLSRKITETYGK